MPDIIDAVAIDNSTVNSGLDGTSNAVTNATATSSSTSVAGIAAANAKSIEAVGIDDSYISAGQDQTITATEDATVTATSSTVTERATNLSVTNATGTDTFTNSGTNGNKYKYPQLQ